MPSSPQTGQADRDPDPDGAHDKAVAQAQLGALLRQMRATCRASGMAVLARANDRLAVAAADPAGLAGQSLPPWPGEAPVADGTIRGTADLPWPAAFDAWPGETPAYIVVLALPPGAGADLLLTCWARADRPDPNTLQSLRQDAAILLSCPLELRRLAAEKCRLADRLDAILSNVSLGIAIADATGEAHVNAIAAGLLGLDPGPADPGRLTAALRDLRTRCEVRSALDIDRPGRSDNAEYWMLPAAADHPGATAGVTSGPANAGGPRRVIRSEGHAIGSVGHGGRIWLFTDVTALWESGERFKRLSAELLASRASIEEQAQQALELAEELHQQKQELEVSKRESDYLANHDPLTGLNNRRAFRHALQQMMDVARGTRGQVAILFIDLDRFKAVNDTLGHDTGDQLLKQVAQILTEALRDTDLLARFGGDEFAIATRVPAQGDLAKVSALGERIRQKLQIAVPAPAAENPGAAIDICGTIGIALYPDDADNIDELFICADQAMYAGKKSGRNRVVLFRALLPG
ncbi:diguanylate cyclase (GGDEF)-like protein [Dongia mobilis]|uniref:Diguanylate cyclase (GGDEF)-like protein n=1 Tax=Dongia mobilis TaxID=578943 RepID=A0A4R6WNE0_9PROT|nr:GGDEF domain-containing protein [Dongia mobilis]TDQ82542.1 diguanylate cyclase (GGDEF)-like protein [Dongia mobilis]